MLPKVSDLRVVEFAKFDDGRGELAVAELQAIVSFSIRRIFWIRDVPVNASRGGHAHKRCNQLMICMTGQISVEVYDGYSTRTLSLTAGTGIHVPPGIFASERFEVPHAVLAVLCDRPYEKDDYIHDSHELMAFRRAAESTR